MEAEAVDGARHGLAGFGGEADDAEAGGSDLFGELIDVDVGEFNDKDLAHVLVGEMEDECDRRDRLAGSGGGTG